VIGILGQFDIMQCKGQNSHSLLIAKTTALKKEASIEGFFFHILIHASILCV